MKSARKAIESMYIGRCSITEYRKIKQENKATGFEEVVVLENQPCRLSFESISSTKPTESVALLPQTAKVFIAPDIPIKPGSKLIIKQNGITTAYKSSGEPARYSTHQEMMLTLFDGWA